MNRFLGCVIVFVSLAAASIAQSPVWEHKSAGSFDTLMKRDSSGNIYVAMADATPARSELWLKKYDANGVLQFARLLRTRPYARPFTVTGLEISTNYIAVSAYNTNADTGAKTAGYLTGVTPANVQSWAIDYPSSYPKAISTNGSSVGVALETAGDAVVRSIAISNGNQIYTAPLTGVSSVSSIAHTLNGSSYVVGGNNVVGVSFDGSIMFSTTLISNTHDNETGLRVLYDATNAQLVVVGQGNHASTSDLDVIIWSINHIIGSQSYRREFGGSNIDETPQDVCLDSAGNIYVAAHRHAAPTETMVIKTTWTVTSQFSIVYPCGSLTSKAIAVVAGDVVVADAMAGNISRVARVSGTNGSARYSMSYAADTTENAPNQLTVDSAGNFFVTGNYDPDNLRGAYVARLGYAWLSTSTGVPIGGTVATGTINMAQPAASNQTFSLVSTNTAVAQVPANVQVNAGALFANFNITTSAVSSNTNVTINANRAGFVMQRTVTVLPPVISAVTVNPNVVLGGLNTTGTATLTGIAPTGGLSVSLGTSPSSVATTLPSVTVPAGSSNANFTIFTTGVQANTGIVVSGTTGTVTKTAFFAVNAPSLTTLSIAPSTVTGGLNATLTIGLDGIAGTDGRSIVLFSGAPGIVFVPSSAIVPQGSMTHNVNIPTAAVTTSTNVLIFATRSGIYKTTTITVTP